MSFDIPCAVSRDLANYEAMQARWELDCEAFDEDVFDLVSEEIEKALEALDNLADAIASARRHRDLESYENNDLERRVQQAIDLVEG